MDEPDPCPTLLYHDDTINIVIEERQAQCILSTLQQTKQTVKIMQAVTHSLLTYSEPTHSTIACCTDLKGKQETFTISLSQ